MSPEARKLVDEIRIREIEFDVQNQELRATEADLSASRETYLELFDLAPVGYLTISAEGVVGNANLTACRLIGVAREDLVGASFSRFVAAEDQDAFYLHQRRLVATKQPQACELRLRRQEDGAPGETQFWARLEGRLREGSGEPLDSWVALTDVTERKAAELARQAIEARRLAILDSMLDPHVLLEALRDEAGAIVDFVFRDANAAACEFNGLSYDELVGVSLLGKHPAAGASELFGRYVAVIETGQPLVLDDWLYPQDMLGGEERYYDVRAVRVGDGISQTWRDVTDRHEAAAALAASEERYRLIAENAADVIAQSDAEGMITWVSPSVTSLLGWRPDELVGRPIFELLHPDDLPRVLAALRDLVDGAPMAEEARVRNADGGYRWISAAVRTILDESGTMVGRIAGWRDVEERVAAQTALEATLDRLNEAQTIAEIGSWEWDLETDRVWWSDETYRVFGVSPEEFVPGFEANGRFIHPDDLAAYVASFEHSLKTGEPLDLVSRVNAGDGRQKYCSARGRTICSADGRPIRFAGTVMDVTGSRCAEEKLRASEEDFRTLAEAVPQIVWMTDPEGKNTYFNQQWVDYTGMTLEESYGDGWNTPFHPDDRQRAWEAWQRATQDIAPYSLECRLRRADGAYRWWLVRGAPLRDEGGTILKWFGTCTDIEDIKQAEAEARSFNAELEQRVLARTAQLDAANKELEEFVYSAAHDLRAPLRAIDGFSQMIADDAAQRLDAADMAHLQRVRAAAQRMAGLIDHLMALSLASRRDLEIEEVDVSGLASSVVEELRAAEPGREIETAVAPGLRADADEACLRSILANLIGNAWKFTSGHETARIEVGVTEAGGERAFFVRDDGAGFDGEAAEHLFGAFQRYHDPAEFPGDGVGLATVQRLVLRHGGRVWAEGEVERGATFYFTLPGTSAP